MEQKAPKGDRITGKKASADSYMPFYEFLLYDPLYREMKDKAKILYSFLRKKTADWKLLTEKTEAGEEGFTQSYRDDNGEIYVIADNSELAIILQCHPNRVKDQKDELKRFGLLDEVPRFNESGNKLAPYLYALEPKEDSITERWMYIEEMKKLRSDIRKENQEKAEKHKAKKAEKSTNEADSQSNQQNVGWSNSQNVSQSNQQNVSKNINLKGLNSTSEGVKDNPNLKEIDPINILWHLDMPMHIKNKIKIMIADKSINLSVKQVQEIGDAYNYQISNKYIKPDCEADDLTGINDKEFRWTLEKMLLTVPGHEIGSMRAIIDKWVKLAYDFKVKKGTRFLYDWLEDGQSEETKQEIQKDDPFSSYPKRDFSKYVFSRKKDFDAYQEELMASEDYEDLPY